MQAHNVYLSWSVIKKRLRHISHMDDSFCNNQDNKVPQVISDFYMTCI